MNAQQIITAAAPLLFALLPACTALAQAPRTGIALAQYPAWVTPSSAIQTYPTDSAMTFPLDPLNIEIVSAAVQPDGALLVLGAWNTGSGYNWNTGIRKDSLVLCGARFSPDGRPDTTYGRSGWMHYDIPGPESIRNIRAALQTDGKWVVAMDFTYQKDFAVMRFEPDGRLDTTFRQIGYVLFTNDPAQTDELKDLSVLPGGKILLIVSSRYETLNRDCRIIRLNPDGMRDTSFDRDGVLLLAERPWIGACRMLPDGRFVLVSYNQDWLQAERYLPDGLPDLKYGRFGKVYTRIETVNSDFFTLFTDGSLTLQGYESTLCETGQPGRVFRSRQYDALGRPDTLWDTTPFASADPAICVINDTTWMTFLNEGAKGNIARFYGYDGIARSNGLHFSGILSGMGKHVIPSPQGGAFVADVWKGLLMVAYLLPNGRLSPAYGLDSLTIAAQGYTIRITEQPEKTLAELKEIHPSPSPYTVWVTDVNQDSTAQIITVTPSSHHEFAGIPCYSPEQAVLPSYAGKDLHLHLQNRGFPGNDADWSAISPERLRGLSLNNCRFEGKIPAELRRFKQLQVLEIRYDSTLTDFQRHLDEALRLIPFFPRLQCLIIYAPGLTQAPKSLRKLQHLVSLELALPGMVHFPDAVARLKNLRELRLTFRCPDGLPAAIGRLDSLQLLELTGFGPAARLQLPETLGRLQNLKELRLKEGARPSVLPVSAGALWQLEKFEIVNAGITTLPDSLGACTRIQEITIITNGNFERLPERFLDLPNLTKLQLEVCQPEPRLRFQGERLRRLATERNVWFEIRLY